MALCAAVLVVVTPAPGAFAAAPFKPRQLSAFERRKAELLLDAKLPCLGCHELNGSGGRIGPSLTDVRTRRSADYISTMISDPEGTVPGTIMPRVRMTGRTRELIANYLLQPDGAPPRAAAGGPPVRPRPASSVSSDAASLYARFCAPCHGAGGGGDGFNASALPVRPAAHSSKTSMSTRSDDALFDTIFSGGYIMSRSNFMPPFGATLTRDQIRGLVKYIRSLCGCDGPAWSRDDR
jgi:mono/diheme cytochrome c family protein